MKSILKNKFIDSSSLTNVKITPWKLSQVYEDKVYINLYIKLLEETPDFDQKDNKVDMELFVLKV